MLAMKLHEKLQMLCKQKGWGQSSLLERVPAVTKSTISNWWHGKYSPDLASALAIARALEVSLDYLADDSQDEPPTRESLPEDERYILQMYRDFGLTRKVAAKALAVAAKDQHFAGTADSGDVSETKVYREETGKKQRGTA